MNEKAPLNKPENWDKLWQDFKLRKERRAGESEIPGFVTLENHIAELPPELQSRLREINLQELSPWAFGKYNGNFFYTENSDPGLPAMNLVFVESADHNTGADNPGDLGGGETDLHLIYEGLSRVHVKAMLAGASTIRGANIVLGTWRQELVKLRERMGLGRYPIQIIATESGSLQMDKELIFNVPEIKVMVLTTDQGRQKLLSQIGNRPWVEVISTGEKSDFKSGLKTLKSSYGIDSISAIGGRTVATELINQNLVQDLYLTTSVTKAGEPNTPFYPQRDRLLEDSFVVLKKEGREEEQGVIFRHLILPTAP